MISFIKRSGRVLVAMATAFGLCTGLALAEAPTAPETAPPAPVTLPTTATPALWTLTKGNGQTIIFLGSVHLLPPNLSWKTPAITAAIEGADIVVTEIMMSELSSPELVTYVQTNGMYPTGTTLRSKLSPEGAASFEAACTFLGIPAVALDTMKPWLANLTLSVLLATKSGYVPASGVEMALEPEIAAANKQRGAFETALEQVKFFTDMSEEDSLNALVTSSEQILEDPDILNRLVIAWAAGDVAEMKKLIVDAMDETPELRKVLLEDRNARWVARIQAEFLGDDKDYFIIVGAAHLVGDGSVIDLLRKAGVTIEGP